MKRRNLLLATGVVCMVMTGCGQGDAKTETESMAVIQEAESVEMTEESTEQSVESQSETEAPSEEVKEAETEPAAEKETEEAESGYADNFAVDSETAAAFGKKVKEAVAEKNIEKLADLTGFPVYVGIPGNEGAVDTREEFIALGADQVITEGLMSSVAAADETSLSPSMAGFSLSGEGSTANVNFGVRDGKLLISGINY